MRDLLCVQLATFGRLRKVKNGLRWLLAMNLINVGGVIAPPCSSSSVINIPLERALQLQYLEAALALA